ncbi:hypothetical protein SPS_9 [Sphingomonas phage Scott]|uniref:Uncharacterized protein n=1 Tax=Sphingomonas phage Scott TaxID=2282912 RepID=A0A346FDA6_9CAUD|nr:hypothetical protein HOT83_gp09 [Sphingomonas phage Scott]AXN53720.1 hypothetical protein SPS_9 [Sphingomonas phage Scott]
MSDLRNRLDNWRQGMNLLGFNPDNVNWQSIAVLVENCPQRIDLIKEKLLCAGGGWATHGHREDSDGTSLYLSPKGMVYWLDYGGHYTLYSKLMGCEQHHMDRAGWLHISGGRVDVYCRMTAIQQRWLDEHKPHPDSANAMNGDWRINDAIDHTQRDRHWQPDVAPKPYADAEPFDIRPVADDEWDRLEMRIAAAKERQRHAELAG